MLSITISKTVSLSINVIVATTYTTQPIIHVHVSWSTRITDAFNNVRDRVRYLESLSPHFEPLESLAPPFPSPSQVISTILPALMATLKQMEGVSRTYAYSGYLGVLCIKVLYLFIW